MQCKHVLRVVQALVLILPSSDAESILTHALCDQAVRVWLTSGVRRATRGQCPPSTMSTPCLSRYGPVGPAVERPTWKDIKSLREASSGEGLRLVKAGVPADCAPWKRGPGETPSLLDSKIRNEGTQENTARLCRFLD